MVFSVLPVGIVFHAMLKSLMKRNTLKNTSTRPLPPGFDSVRIYLIVSRLRKSKHEYAVSYHPPGEVTNAKSRVTVLVNCKVFVVHVLETPERVGISFQKNPVP